MGSEKALNNHAYIVAQPVGVFDEEELQDLKVRFDEFTSKLAASGDCVLFGKGAGSLLTAPTCLNRMQAILLDKLDDRRIALAQDESRQERLRWQQLSVRIE